MLCTNFVRLAEDTIKEKDIHKYSFDNRISYKNTVSKLIVSILIIQQSYEDKSEYCDKFYELYERLENFYKSLDVTKEWS